MPNLFDPQWDASRDEPPYHWRRSRLGLQAGSRALGASLFELAPGGATFPLHAHLANEELLLVLAGRPTLTGPDGAGRALEPGAVDDCNAGRGAAHRPVNHSEEP